MRLFLMYKMSRKELKRSRWKSKGLSRFSRILSKKKKMKKMILIS